jgi:hypothetical protein
MFELISQQQQKYEPAALTLPIGNLKSSSWCLAVTTVPKSLRFTTYVLYQLVQIGIRLMLATISLTTTHKLSHAVQLWTQFVTAAARRHLSSGFS